MTMGDSQESFEVETLLARADWVRRLAAGLVSDAASADDIVQDAWTVALERPPARSTNIEGWFVTVVRNAARRFGRSEGRRKRREEAASRPEAQTSTAELAAMQRDVLDHVLTLDEPFQSTVLARFFDELAPGEIAARDGVPLKTVHSRLQRAFEKLRWKLDREYGDRASWCAAFLPLARGSAPATKAAAGSVLVGTGAWIMNVSTKLAVATAIAALGGIGVWLSFSGGPAERVSTPIGGGSLLAPVPTPKSRDEQAPVRAPVAEGVEREGTNAPATPSATPAKTETIGVFGRVVDLSGEPVGGVAIRSDRDPSRSLAVTASDGFFELELAGAFVTPPWSERPRPTYLRVFDEALATVCEAGITESNWKREHVIVATPATELSGFVVDGGGVPIAGASVRLHPARNGFVGFPYALDSAKVARPGTESDQAGRFELGKVPTGRGLKLFVSAEGYEPTELDTAELAAGPVLVELSARRIEDEAVVEGIVIDERGFPVEGALVKLADSTDETGAGGRFRVEFDWVVGSTPLCAAMEGRLPALIPNFGDIIEAHGRRVPPQELVLGGAPLAICGRVIDENGSPLEGWFVSVADETEISQMRFPLETAEGLARGGSKLVRSKKDGSFRIEGLLRREYTVQAYDDATLLLISAPATAGRDDVVLRVVSDALRAEVSGRLVTRDGVPIPDAEVRLSLNTLETDYGSQFTQGARVLSDESGRFVLSGVPYEHVYLSIDGDAIVPMSYELPRERTMDELSIVVFRRCHFRIEPADPALHADRVTFLSDAGQPLGVSHFTANSMSGYGSARLTDGRSEVLSVSEEASTAIIHRGGAEVDRRAIELDPDNVTVLRF